MIKRSSDLDRAVPLRKKLQTSLLLAFFSLTVTSATAAISPERQSAQIARHLKGIPDQEWAKIAGDHITEKYEVVKGDTLYDISKRLFAEAKYWPKIWELNNPSVLNPHFIYPKNALTFQSGSGSELPGLYVGDVSSRTGEVEYELTSSPGKNLLAEGPGPRWDEKTPKPRAEWRKLPKQTWESYDIQLPAEVDKDGFDSRSFINRGRVAGDALPYLMACEPIEPVGVITGARDIKRHLTMGDEVTVQSNIATLDSNQFYNTLGTALEIKSEDRTGFAYPITGKMKILGVNEGVYVGEILNSSHEINRDTITSSQRRVTIENNVNGPTALLGHIFLDPTNSSYVTAQHKWIFIDRGAADGVAQGMIFRIFQYKDPLNQKDITKAETLVEGDAQVYSTCKHFALARVLWSRSAIDDGTPAILMPDVKDYESRFYLNGNVQPSDIVKGAGELPPGSEANPSGDWLDKLDNGQELNGDEEKELQQLEKYEEPPTTAPEEGAPGSEEGPPASDANPAPGEPALPPPPSEAPPPENFAPEPEPTAAPAQPAAPAESADDDVLPL